MAGEPPVVLVVEDEEPLAEALGYIIEDAGYAAIFASHGKQALELVRLHRPALIMTDLMMPLMDGAELIVALRADGLDGRAPPPPIILMTAGGLRRAQELGADEVLRKPFNIEDVEAILARYLGAGQDAADGKPAHEIE